MNCKGKCKHKFDRTSIINGRKVDIYKCESCERLWIVEDGKHVSFEGGLGEEVK